MSQFAEIVPDSPNLAFRNRVIREDRDRHFHRGEERDLFDPTVPFKSAALLEIHRSHDNFDVEFGEGRALKLGELHEAVVAKIRADYHEAGDALFAHVQALLRLIEGEYRRRWSELREQGESPRRMGTEVKVGAAAIRVDLTFVCSPAIG